jgi:hypothetical protein
MQFNVHCKFEQKSLLINTISDIKNRCIYYNTNNNSSLINRHSHVYMFLNHYNTLIFSQVRFRYEYSLQHNVLCCVLDSVHSDLFTGFSSNCGKLLQQYINNEYDDVHNNNNKIIISITITVTGKTILLLKTFSVILL